MNEKTMAFHSHSSPTLRSVILTRFFSNFFCLNTDIKSGLALIAATTLAIMASNSGFSPLYSGFLETKLQFSIADLSLSKPLLLWINDGLMAIFFFLVGLEIKREVLVGQLNSLQKSTLPLLAAIGGMAVPAAIFYFVNSGSPETLNGWAIPAATDIAFALGILALLGTKAPVSLKILLLAIAIIDDLGAIIIIAAFYSADISFSYLGAGLIALSLAFAVTWLKVIKIWLYTILGLVSWYCFLKSGIHPTLAGVLLAFAIPLSDGSGKSGLLEKLEHKLHGFVAFLILPLFAFANAGVSLTGLSAEMFFQPLPLGIALGLFAGKQIGVFGTIWLSIKCGLSPRPEQTGWAQLYGLSCLTGIGFTMSLFIGGLAFSGDLLADQVRLGVLTGSLGSAVLGFLLLYRAGLSRASALKG